MITEDSMERDVAIDRFWDQVTQGHVDAAGNLDPRDAATIRSLHAGDDRPRPSLAFRRQLREELMHAEAIPVVSEPTLRPRPNGRARSPWSATSLGRPWSPRRLARAPLATAALVALTLVGSYFAFGPGRPGRQVPLPAIVPASIGTPATPQPGVTETLLVDTSVTTPAGPTGIWVYAYVMKPGAISPNDGAVGGLVFMVDQGAVTVTVDDADRVLHAGESWNAYAQTGYTIENTGTDEADLVVVELIDQLASSREAAPDGPFLDGMSGTWDTLVEGAPNLPGGSGRVTVTRLTLAPDAALPTYTQAERDWLGIYAGRLTVKLEGEGLPFRWKSGAERSFSVGQIPPVFPVGSRVTLRNAEADSLVLYNLTVTPSGAAGSSAATSAP